MILLPLKSGPMGFSFEGDIVRGCFCPRWQRNTVGTPFNFSNGPAGRRGFPQTRGRRLIPKFMFFPPTFFKRVCLHDGELTRVICGHCSGLSKKRRRLVARRAFQNWVRRFSDHFDENTTLAGLSDTTLGFLIRGGEEDLLPIYDFILGVLGWGGGVHFYDLEGSKKMYVMDISLFLLDQLRFESMKRLGWVEDFPTRHIFLLDLVEQYGEHFSSRRHETPFLSPTHPFYGEYEKLLKEIGACLFDD